MFVGTNAVFANALVPTTTSSGADDKEEGDKKKDDKKKDDKKKGDEKDDKKAPKTISRPMLKDGDTALAIADQVQLNAENQVRFNLQQQPWQSVLQWIADTSQLSLDWQELPGDTLNLTTTRAYSLPEARDILNRHLLTRGYTMVLNGELLSVMKLSDLKPSLVPRIAPEELSEQLDHTLCKVSFDLNWLIADEAVSEFTPMLSSAGKINKLSRTNRLEIMDTAGSLKDIYQILQNEQSDSGAEQLVKTFRLKHRRASEVVVLLRQLLGVDPPPGSVSGGGGSSGGMSQMTSMMRQIQQQMQQMQNSGGSKAGGGSKMKIRKTRLVLNSRENMLLVQAMPDQMAIIEQAINQIDIPVHASDSLIQNISKMKVYRLNTVDPQTLVDLLQELGDLAPGTVLKVDKDKNSIVAFAALADHLTITTLVQRLDQSGRNVEVIPLRRLDADYVAGTIRALMQPEPKEQNSYSSYNYSYSSNASQKKEEKVFKVEADVENNRLLVFANTIEMEEIRDLLKKLGEIPNPDAVDDGVRIFNMNPSDNPVEIMQQLKQLWQADNPLQFDLPKQAPALDNATESNSEIEPQKKKRVPELTKFDAERVSNPSTVLKSRDAQQFFDKLLQQAEEAKAFDAIHRRPQLTATQLTATQLTATQLTATQQTTDHDLQNDDAPQRFPRSLVGAPSTSDAVPAPQLGTAASPVKIAITPDGRIVVTSNDPLALRQAEELLKELMKPTANYKVFRLKYATASWLTLNLKDYFKADVETEPVYKYDSYWGSYQRINKAKSCLLYTSPSPRDQRGSRMPSSA